MPNIDWNKVLQHKPEQKAISTFYYHLPPKFTLPGRGDRTAILASMQPIGKNIEVYTAATPTIINRNIEATRVPDINTMESRNMDNMIGYTAQGEQINTHSPIQTKEDSIMPVWSPTHYRYRNRAPKYRGYRGIVYGR